MRNEQKTLATGNRSVNYEKKGQKERRFQLILYIRTEFQNIEGLVINAVFNLL